MEPNTFSIEISTGFEINEDLHDGVGISLGTPGGGLKMITFPDHEHKIGITLDIVHLLIIPPYQKKKTKNKASKKPQHMINFPNLDSWLAGHSKMQC